MRPVPAMSPSLSVAWRRATRQTHIRSVGARSEGQRCGRQLGDEQLCSQGEERIHPLFSVTWMDRAERDVLLRYIGLWQTGREDIAGFAASAHASAIPGIPLNRL